MAVYYLLIFVVALLGAGLLAAWMQRSGVNLKGKVTRLRQPHRSLDVPTICVGVFTLVKAGLVH